MTIKSRKRLSPQRIKTPSTRISSGIVDAVVINRPDLSLYLKLQNLLNYFVECMHTLTTHPENHDECAEYLNRCISFISSVSESSAQTFNDEMQSMLQEFTSDAIQFRLLLKLFRNPEAATTRDHTAAVQLTAKASHLQWLSVCILQDLKMTCYSER